MADIQRFRHADSKGAIALPVDSAQVIEVGDMVWLNTDDARPASAFTYVTSSLTRTQANFRRDFIGIAATASASGETDPITIYTRGSFEMDCASATFEVGDLVGPDDNGAGDTLLDQQVIAVGENGYGGIMRVAKRYGSNTTRVVCEILPEAVRHPQGVEFITFGSSVHTGAADMITDFPVEYPFKLVRVHAQHTVAATGQSVLTIDNGATSLDDTLTLTSGAAVGVVDSAAMDDATGDDRFEAGDTLTVKSDGGASAGEVAIILEVKPFLVES